jgi:transcriptional regulator with XRE-family HTH domain
LDLGLQQKEVAGQLGVDEATVTNWEHGRTAPAIRFDPVFIRFLGHDPLPAPSSVGEQLRRHRQRRGLSRKGLARQLGVDEGTLARWERGIRAPKGKFLEILDTVVMIGRA